MLRYKAILYALIFTMPFIFASCSFEDKNDEVNTYINNDLETETIQEATSINENGASFYISDYTLDHVPIDAITDNNIYVTPKTHSAVTFERIEESIKNSHGQKIAVIYYDKPVFSSEIPKYDKLNDFFKQEADGFFNGSYVSKHFTYGYRDHFFGYAKDFINRYGGIEAFDSPDLCCTITSFITYQDERMLSIRQEFEWCAGGIAEDYFYGYTVDLIKGEFLLLSNFINIDNDKFNKLLINSISESMWDDWKKDHAEELENKVAYREWWDYPEFYIDSEFLYVIVEKDIYYYDGNLAILPRDDVYINK